ncbi:MAG: hypothetical protein KAV82_04770 [Phycisphaerae bacterium]|nr:hypothetical protein [Phycisphaerae bacterium]
MIGEGGFSPITERIQGIRDHFAGGGSWAEALVVLLVLGTALLVLVLIQRLRHEGGRGEPDHPIRLFRTLLSRLNLPSRRRRILCRMSSDLDLKHPTMMLLSPQLFREHAATWARAMPDAPLDELVAIEQCLFPHHS